MLRRGVCDVNLPTSPPKQTDRAFQAAVLRQDLSPSVPDRSTRFNLVYLGSVVTLALEARRWIRAKVNWEMSADESLSRQR